MSNETRTPGMDNPYQSNEGYQPNQYQKSARHDYSESQGTVVPGMNKHESNSIGQTTQMMEVRPVVGFLYSISRGQMGEFWPVYLGRNTIGRSEQCDVCLQEASVSRNHSVLLVRMVKNTKKIIAALQDSESCKIGSMVNGVSLVASAVECKNGDVLTIGDNYELLFILIDPAEHGLSVSEDFTPASASPMPTSAPASFIASPSNPYEGNYNMGGYNMGSSTTAGGVPPSFQHPDPAPRNVSRPRNYDGTVGISGEREVHGGGTQIE